MISLWSLPETSKISMNPSYMSAVRYLPFQSASMRFDGPHACMASSSSTTPEKAMQER